MSLSNPLFPISLTFLLSSTLSILILSSVCCLIPPFSLEFTLCLAFLICYLCFNLFPISLISPDLSILIPISPSFFHAYWYPLLIPPLSTGWAELWHGPSHQTTLVENHLWRSERKKCCGSHLSQVRKLSHTHTLVIVHLHRSHYAGCPSQKKRLVS